MLPLQKLGIHSLPYCPNQKIERTVWKVATATRLPGEPSAPQTLYFWACSELEKKFIRNGDEGDHIHTCGDTCLHGPTFTLSWALLLSPDTQEKLKRFGKVALHGLRAGF